MTLADGRVFVTYFQFFLSQQILIWTNSVGTVVREDTLMLSGAPTISFAYAEGSQVVLVDVMPSQAGVNVTLRPFAEDGTQLPTITLHEEAFDADVEYNATSFHYDLGQLLMLLVTQREGTNPIEYSARVVRRMGGTTTAYDPWLLGPVSIDDFARAFSVAAGPWGTGLVTYIAGDNTDQEVWVQAFDNNGQTSTLIYPIPVEDGSTCNFAVPFVLGTTVYACFTSTELPGGIFGGTFLSAFPLNEILEAEDDFIPQPSSFSLSAYPNPFNAAVRMNYDLSTASDVGLVIYDLHGRAVATFVSEHMSAGSHSVLWNAEGLPSGIYLARLNAGELARTQKLVLLK